jgi:CheY-like chemotaxis protein
LTHQSQGVQGGALLIEDASVLIVDRSTEARGVLRTALERLGVRVFETADAEDGLALARKHRPDLVLLDLDAASRSAAPAAEDFAAYADDSNATLLILGPSRLRAPVQRAGQPTRFSAGAPRPVPRGEFVAKPYHYEPLVRKIEQLLRAREMPNV